MFTLAAKQNKSIFCDNETTTNNRSEMISAGDVSTSGSNVN